MTQSVIHDDSRSDLRIGLWPHAWTIGEAADLERQCLLAVREEFPEWNEFIGSGYPKKYAQFNLDDRNSFVETILKLRRTHPRGRFYDPDSQGYNEFSIPSYLGSTTSNVFQNPSPKNPIMPPWDGKKLWSMSFSINNSGMRARGDDVTLQFVYGAEKFNAFFERAARLFEKLIPICEPEFIRFAQLKFDRAFWKASKRIGWLNYFSHPPLVEQLLKHPRARPFFKGAILQLSDDPNDMMCEDFINEAFEYSQTLIPYWPD